MREFRGITYGILLGAFIIFLLLFLLGCGGSGSGEVKGTVKEQRDMTEQERGWWMEVGECLANNGIGTMDMINDIPEPFMVVIEGELECQDEQARGCAFEDRIVIAESFYAEWLFKHEVCHTYGLWLLGDGSRNTPIWNNTDQGHRCICEWSN